MASRGEIGWQSEKTLAECMRYMLDNDIATDVCFEVGPPDGATVNIRAHKYMLISRSPVFEAMFLSQMSETTSKSESKIRIVDMKAEAFKLLLSFIYCDSVNMDFGSAPMLLYAAKKYLLPKLTEYCSRYLRSILDTKNVCRILELSVSFDVEDLKSHCLAFVANNSEIVLNGDELLKLSRVSLEAILRVDRIMSGASALFNSCVKWAKYQLLIEQSIETPNDLQIRKTLGSLLYEIPFPTTSVTEFANLIGESDILTTKEQSAVYYYLASRKGKDKLKFCTENRHERVANIATKSTKGLWPQSQCSTCSSIKKSTFEIGFKTNRDILLTGLGLYTGHNGSKYTVDVEISQVEDTPQLQQRRRGGMQQVSQGKEFIRQKSFVVPYTESSSTFKVSFDEPISIIQGKLYSISTLACDAIGYSGELCNEVLADDVTFTFVSVPVPQNMNGCFGFPANPANIIAASGQIPQLYFIPMPS